jgi:hypothetical protein
MLQFLLRHDLDTDLLLTLPAPVVEDLLPISALLGVLHDLLISADCRMPALGSDLALAHLQVFSHNHDQLDF